MVLARHLHRSERPPGSGGGVPQLARVDAVVQVHEPGPGRIAAGGEHAAVRQHGEVVLPAAVRHRRRSRYLRRSPVDVDDAGIIARGPSARDEDLAHVIEGMAAVVAVQGVALAEVLPRASSGCIEAPHRRVGTGVEGTAIGRYVHPRIQRLVERGRVERAQTTVRFEHLRHGRSARGDQRLPVGKGGDARVPPSGRHVRPKAPRIGVRVEEVRLHEAVELGVHGPTGDEQGSVHEVDQAAAKDVVARGHVHRRLRAGGGVPHRGAGVVLDRVGLGCVVAHRVIREHLSVREQRHVHGHHRPVDNRAPLAHLVRAAGDRRRLGVHRGGRRGVPLELPLRDRVERRNGVLLNVAQQGARVVSTRGRYGSGDKDRGREDDSEDEYG